MTGSIRAKLLSLTEMARELHASPGWVGAQVEAGLIPARQLDQALWFRRDLVKWIVAQWEAECFRVEDRTHEPMPRMRYCHESPHKGNTPQADAASGEVTKGAV